MNKEGGKEEIKSWNNEAFPWNYQTLHLCLGFIGEPKGQLYASEKSSEFESGPFTLKLL